MSLWKFSQELNPVLNYWHCSEKPCYRLWGTQPGNKMFNFYFCSDTIHYSERLSPHYARTNRLFYYPQYDCYFLHVTYDNCWIWGPFGFPMVNYAYCWRIPADGSSGAVSVGGEALAGLQYFYGFSFAGVEAGSYGKVYGTGYFFNNGVFEYNPITLSVIPGWGINYNELPAADPWWVFSAPANSLVNREDGILMLNSSNSSELLFWNIKEQPYTFKGRMNSPGKIIDVSYEDRYRMWTVTNEGYLHKINYHLLRTELLSEVQDKSPDDLAYLVAFDTKRHRLAVFIHRPDGPNGECRAKIHFYRPIPKVDLVTDPVPVRPVRYGKRVPFSFHLVGSAGEGISPYKVGAELEAPVDGSLMSHSVGTGQYGVGSVPYQAPMYGCSETLELEVDISDGD